jgi:hypothetical protein
MFEGKAKAYLSETSLTCSTLGQAAGLTHKHLTSLKKLGRDGHSSLLQNFVNYDCKIFYDIGPSWNIFKTLGINMTNLSLS